MTSRSLQIDFDLLSSCSEMPVFGVFDLKNHSPAFYSPIDDHQKTSINKEMCPLYYTIRAYNKNIKRLLTL